jgi:hypothetical protein
VRTTRATVAGPAACGGERTQVDQLVVDGGAGADTLVAGPGLGALLAHVLID